ncbi:unnamed protein product [Strongylus vulgaris]|uniref:Uncharacterized protein n=1 Tax=Strongylus vulgaris TaxID=40348 RepID=A0A3P7K259_STRVU|nr:unnamed protein product [Strongylus vulgaris]
MPKVVEERCGHDSHLEKILTVVVEQIKMQHDEIKSMFATLSRSQGGTVQDASKDQYDQLSRDVQKFASDEETGKKFQGNETCYVTEGANLLGSEWCIQLPAYKKLKNKYHCRKETREEEFRAEVVAYLKKQYAEVFKCGLGKRTKSKAKLSLKEQAIPVFKKKRPVPYATAPEWRQKSIGWLPKE